jgi:hypothetical protein
LSGRSDYQDALDAGRNRESLDDRWDGVERRLLVTDILLGATVVSAGVAVAIALWGDSDGAGTEVAVSPQGFSLHHTF